MQGRADVAGEGNEKLVEREGAAGPDEEFLEEIAGGVALGNQMPLQVAHDLLFQHERLGGHIQVCSDTGATSGPSIEIFPKRKRREQM